MLMGSYFGFCPRGHAALLGVEHNVAQQFAEVVSPLDEERVEPSLQKMPERLYRWLSQPSVRAVSQCIRGEIGLGSLDDEVIVIRHQYPGSEAPTKTRHSLAEKGEE